MATSPVITRRAALVGAIASTAALAVPAAAALPNYELPIDAQLTILANEYYERAKAIDPTITGAWFGHDMRGPTNAFESVIFQRGDSPAMKMSRERRERRART